MVECYDFWEYAKLGDNFTEADLIEVCKQLFKDIKSGEIDKKCRKVPVVAVN